MEFTARVPNLVVLTSGRSGSSLLVKILQAIAWRVNDTENDFGESPAIVDINNRYFDGADPGEIRSEIERYIGRLAEPWVIKDPRLGPAWSLWRPILEALPRPPVILLSYRDLDKVERSFERQGWYVGAAKRQLAAAILAFSEWPGDKLYVPHRRVLEAAALVDPRRESLQLVEDDLPTPQERRTDHAG